MVVAHCVSICFRRGAEVKGVCLSVRREHSSMRFEDNGTMIPRVIYTYWETIGDYGRPEYIDLCVESIDRWCSKGFEIKHLNRTSAFELLDGVLNPAWVDLEPVAIRADIVRYALLSSFGGIWLDSDVLILNDLERACQFVDAQGYDSGIRSMAFQVANQNAAPQTAALKEAEACLQEGRRIAWGHLGKIATATTENSEQSGYISPDMIVQPGWRNCDVLELPSGDIDRFVSEKSIAWIFYNDVLRREFRPLYAMTREEIYESDSVAGEIFRRSLHR